MSNSAGETPHKERTEHKPLYCDECGTRIVITIGPQGSTESVQHYECECATLTEDDSWPDTWTTSVAREGF